MTSTKSITSVVSVAFCGAIYFSSAIQAQEVGVTGMMTLDGTCKKLVVKGKDRTADCKGTLLNVDYSDGRTGFYFVTTDQLIVTFSNKGKQVHPDPNTAIAPVDMVIVGKDGKFERITAVGTCKLTNPHLGRPAPVECKAEAASDVFEGFFISDGGKPDVKTF
jgi:hypothetical protein